MKKVLAIMINDDTPIDGQCLWSLVNQDYKNLEIIIRAEKPKIEHADPVHKLYLNCAANREAARKIALKSNADYFFFMDADVDLPLQDTISKMMNQIQNVSAAVQVNPVSGEKMRMPKENRKRHIIGGWYRTFNKHRWVAGKWVKNNTFSNYDKPLPNLVETDMVGLGCALISREALQKLHFRPGMDKKADNLPMCKCGECKIIKHAFLGECLDFGNQAIKNKFRMFMDGDIICGHVKRVAGERVTLK